MNEREEQFSRLVSITKCPICGGKLDRGYYHTPRGVYWSDKTHRAGMVALDYVKPGALWVSRAQETRNSGLLAARSTNAATETANRPDRTEKQEA